MTPWANNGREQAQQSDPLFDHIVCDGEQMIRHLYAERLGGLEVDHEVKL
jgi:hypothetical protein